MRFALLLALPFLGVSINIAETDANPKAAPKASLTNVALDKLIARMTDAKGSYKDRCDAEDELAKRPAQEVLPKLLPLVVKGGPGREVYNSLGSREKDREAPAAWQIYETLRRAYFHQLDGLPPKEGGRVLVALLKGVSKDTERSWVIYALASHWDASAEADLAKILRNIDEPPHVRREAALPLILHGKEDYRDVMHQWAAKADYNEKLQWFGLLGEPRLKQRYGADPRFISLGFRLIHAGRNKSPEYVGGGYFQAGTIGAYVGQKFAPDQFDPRYKSETGLNDRYFEDTVQNALRWWAKNRDKYEKE